MKIFVMTAVILFGIENVCATEVQREEDDLLMRRKQGVTQFISHKEEILQDLKEIEGLSGSDQIKRLREFGYNNLNYVQSRLAICSMENIFNTLSASLKSADKNYKHVEVIGLVKNKLESDFLNCEKILEQTKLSEGNFPRNEFWNYEQKFRPTDLIQITHGGGLCHLLDCFEGKKIGYRLERGGVGIQVHPSHRLFENNGYSSITYAYYAMTKSLDFPVVLTGFVQAQYLMPADNYFEAAIKVSHLKYIENAKLTLVTGNMIENPLCSNYLKNFCELMAPNLKDRLEKFNNKTS